MNRYKFTQLPVRKLCHQCGHVFSIFDKCFNGSTGSKICVKCHDSLIKASSGHRTHRLANGSESQMWQKNSNAPAIFPNVLFIYKNLILDVDSKDYISMKPVDIAKYYSRVNG